MDYQVDKYFVPQIEDIRVGYECQVQSIENAQWGNFTITEKWMWDGTTIFEYLELGNVRVPHLTKEQIEAEAWKKVKNITGALAKTIIENDYTFIKNGYCFQYYPDVYEGKILYFAGIYPSDILYKGECKDINTFRHICKLLKI